MEAIGRVIKLPNRLAAAGTILMPMAAWQLVPGIAVAVWLARVR